MTDLKSILVKMVFLGVLIFSIMSFIVIIQLDNSVNQADRITNNSLIADSFKDLEGNISQQKEAQSALDNLEKVPPTTPETIGDLSVASTVSTTRTATSISIGVWNVLIKLPQVILGVSPIVSSAITSILLLIIAIGIWAIWKGAIS